MMLRPQLAFDSDADGDGAKHGEAVAGAIIACVRKQLLETMAECGMDGAQADAALDVLLERTQILAAKAAPADNIGDITPEGAPRSCTWPKRSNFVSEVK